MPHTDKGFRTWQLTGIVRYLLTSPVFAGPENWYRTLHFFKPFLSTLLTTAVLQVGVEMVPADQVLSVAQGQLSIRVEAADPALDSRAGKPLSEHVLVLRFYGNTWRVRLRSAAGGVATVAEGGEAAAR